MDSDLVERLIRLEEKVDALLSFAHRTTEALDAFGERLSTNPLFRVLSGGKK